MNSQFFSPTDSLFRTQGSFFLLGGARCLFFFVFSFSSMVWAKESYVFEKIYLTGRQRTEKYVLENELGFKSGQRVSYKQVKEGIENLRNIRIFSDVQYEIKNSGEKGSKSFLHIYVKERWTTVPILIMSSGGGENQFRIGVFDPNVLGHLLETRFEYQKIGSVDSWNFYLNDPRFLGQRQGLGLRLSQSNRVRNNYDPDSWEPVELSDFLHAKNQIYLSYTRELNRKLRYRFTYEWNKDHFPRISFKDKFVDGRTPRETSFHFLGLGLDKGLVHFDDYLLHGNLLSMSFRYGLSQKPSVKDFLEINGRWLYYHRFFRNHIFAQRFLSGITTSHEIQYFFYLGGLNQIRGFSDNRFMGAGFLLSNTEYRVPLGNFSKVVVQGVGFLDMTTTFESFKQIWLINGGSYGGGLRFIVPEIYDFILRIDYAIPFQSNDSLFLSFGAGQFF